jgi:hypothetical protein
MAHFPTHTPSDDWILSTVRNLLNEGVDPAILGDIFGNQVLPHIQNNPNFLERTYGETFYGDFHHPKQEFVPYTTQLMQRLDMNTLLRNLNRAGSYRSWMDLRALMQRPEITDEVLNELDMLANLPIDHMSIEQAVEHPERAIVDEMLRLRRT